MRLLLALAVVSTIRTLSTTKVCLQERMKFDGTNANTEPCNMNVINIKDAAELKTLLSNAGDTLVVIAFYASWCKWSKSIAPKVENLANQLKNSVIFVTVDGDVFKPIAHYYNVRSYPTLVFVKKYKERKQVSSSDYNVIEQAVRKYQ